MVATTFAADTPVATKKFYAKNGITRNWISGVVLVYSILFGTGSLIFGNMFAALICLISATFLIVIIYKNLQHVGWSKLIT